MVDLEHAGGGWLLGTTAPDAVFAPEDLSGEQLAIARAAADFVEGEVLPRTVEIEKLDPELTRRLLRQAGELGLLAVEVLPEYGGLGLDLTSASLVTEQFGRQASFAVSHGAHAGIGTLPLVYFGTEAQKRRYLPGLSSGELVGAFALSEAGYGSDALRAATRARLDAAGARFALNGTKMWTSNAAFADLFTLFAQVEGDGAAGERTFTAFLVERSFPGVSIGREEHKLGIKGSSTCRLILEDAEVPSGNLLHEIGRGHVVALNVLNAGRLKLASGLLGGARDLVRVSARYANERQQMGRPISQFGLIQHKLAEQAVRLFAAESACYRVCGMVEREIARLGAESGGPVNASAGEDARLSPKARALEEYLIECAMMKVQASEMIDYVVDEALQIHGGYGYTEEFPVARAYRDARINRIFEGTNEINRLTIAGTLFRRAQRGRLPLVEAIGAARDELLGPGTQQGETGTELDASLAAVADGKKLCLLVAGAAGQRFGEQLAEQQEIMARLADMVIDLFAAESSLLRAMKPGDRSERGALAAKMAQVVAGDALARTEASARQVLAALAAGDELRAQLALFRRLARRLPVDGISLRREIAARVIDEERYPLAVV
jgi:alkylation response protein AidB-like acyl-CoA dehydrogenase